MSLQELKKTRSSYKAKLTQFTKFLNIVSNKLLNNVQVAELNLRLSKIEDMYHEYDTVQLNIEKLTDISENNESSEFDEREYFEAQYFSTIAIARELLSRSTAACSDEDKLSETGSVKHASGGPSLKLPIIQLPTFSGRYQDWLEFHDTFVSLIHDNPSIPKIHKFHYMRSAIKDSAKQVISALEFSASNYDVAWQLLCDRFHNDKLLIHNHIQALFDIEQGIHKESSVALRNLHDTINKNLRALNSLNIQTNNWDILIIHIVTSKLDSSTNREWKEHTNLLKDLPTLNTLNTFLKGHADLLETVEHTSVKRRASEPIQNRPHRSFITNSNTYTKHIKCPYCKQEHPIYQCIKFKSLSHQAKIQKVNQLNLCENCLRAGHNVKQCKLGPCRNCANFHNTILCDSGTCKESESTVLVSNDTCKQTSDTDIEGSIENNTVLSSTTKMHKNCVLLSTALIDIVDHKGTTHTVRALLDNGSTTNFLTESLCNKLQLPVHSTSITVEGLGRKPVYIHKHSTVNLSSRTQPFIKSIDCLVVAHITQALPTVQVDTSAFDIPPGIQLADPGYHIPSEIHMLLSAEVFWDVLDVGRISLGKRGPTLSETKLGWLVSGIVPTKQNKHSTYNNTVHCHFSNDIQVQHQLNRFFELESIQSPHKLTNEENECEQFFSNTTKRQDDGRFVVKIPLKQSPDVLGDSYQQALTRFHSLEKRFMRDLPYKQKYCEFMQEYLDLGHMSLNETKGDKYSYILPHHGILKESNLTSKLRTVFDGSATTTSGLSFNCIQRVGPVIQDDLISILIRFRQHKYVVTSDVKMMYRCIQIADEQRCLQQILWRFNPSEEIQLYKLNTVTYGTASAPFLATRCLVQLGLECTNPVIQEAILLFCR